jgi:glycerol kinase
MGDSQAALFAQRCFQAGMGKVTLGTGSSVLLNLGSELRHGENGIVTALAWAHRGEPTYCFEGIINYAAATVTWLQEQLGLIRSADETEAAATSVEDNGGVYLVPAFAGLGAPHWRAQARAALVGMTAHTQRAHVLRAALESIAYQVCDVLDAMRSSSGVDLKTLCADGGATRNQFLMQFMADVTGVELQVADNPDCSSLGVALAGALGMGRYNTLEELAALPRPSRCYRPALPAAQVAACRAGWQRAVKQVLAGVD